jgi:cyanate lyase
MKREELTEKILDIKRENNWTWKHITDEIGGMSPVLVVGALLGQMKLPKPLAERAAPCSACPTSKNACSMKCPCAECQCRQRIL